MKTSFIIAGFLCIICGVFLLPFEGRAQRGLNLGKDIMIPDEEGEERPIYKDSHALIIGNSEYEYWPVLPGVSKDVSAVEEALKAHGFEVIVKTDLSKQGIEDAFNEFINTYGQEAENRLIFYFAGHGHTVKMSYGEEIGYIVPIDAPNPNEDLPGFQTKALDMQRIEYYAKRIHSKHALFLFDACFSGSLFALSRAVPEIISYKTALPVRQFITSGSADETVPDESIFRAQFVRALQGEADHNRDGYLTGTELGEFLQNTVVNYSYNSQHPQYGKIRNPNLDKGDFVFKTYEASVPESSPDIAAPPEISSNFDDIEAQLQWQEYLDQMQETAEKLQRYEQLNVEAASKVAAWERFLDSFSEDNPYSVQDDTLRKAAQDRVSFWKRDSATIPEILPEASVPATPSTPTPAQAIEIPPQVEAQPAKEWRDPEFGMEFVWIEAGCFEMGSPEGEQGRSSSEGPVRDVCLEGFWMGKYEVTQMQWEQVAGANPSAFNAKKIGAQAANHPVEQVTWEDVKKFISRLNRKVKGESFRLPSEAEWEYAARAGTSTAYYFGDSAEGIDTYAWFRENSKRSSQSVGQKGPNQWGLYDMHGNVWEWCADPSHDDYRGAPMDGRVWTERGDKSLRMLRGGSWNSHPFALRSANRLRNKANYKNNSVGFRLIRSGTP